MSFLLRRGAVVNTGSSVGSLIGLGRELEALIKSAIAGATFGQFLPRDLLSSFQSFLAVGFFLWAEF